MVIERVCSPSAGLPNRSTARRLPSRAGRQESNDGCSNTALRDDARAWIERVQAVNIIVAIPSYNNALTI